MTNRDRRPFSGSDRHYMNPPYPSSSSSSAAASSLKGCCCCLFLLLMFLALLALAIALVVILVIRPKKPDFDLQHVGVEYLLLAPEAASAAVGTAPAAYLSLNITLLFRAVNPNAVGIQYGSADLSVMHGGVPLAQARVPGFEQPAHSSRMVETRVTLSRLNVVQADASDLLQDAQVNDRVELGVAGDVGAKVLFLGLSSPRVQVSLYCAIVISPRKQSLSYKQCGVDGLNV